MTKIFAWVEELLYNHSMSQFLMQNSHIILKLVVAAGLGMLIGLERILVHKEAGMKTHALVFLGAGSIILQGNRLLGLTTASGLWVTAGIGMATGFGFFGLASITTVLVLFILIVIYLFEKPIRKISDSL